MAIASFNPDDVWKPFGAFAMAAVQGDGKIVHLKGQVSLDRDGNLVGEGDIDTQVRQALDNVKTVLENFGGRMEDIYALTHHVTNIDEFMTTGHIRSQYFKPPYPVTTSVEVVRLYHPLLKVEITAAAEIPLARFRMPDEH